MKKEKLNGVNIIPLIYNDHWYVYEFMLELPIFPISWN